MFILYDHQQELTRIDGNLVYVRVPFMALQVYFEN
jgi:hypothetical protein